MLDGFRRWFSGSAARSPALLALARWAEDGGHGFKPVRDEEGGVVDFANGAQAWRIEWGKAQRSYIAGPELRLIAEAGLPRDLQILVINLELAESLEQALFEQAVDDVQTRIDSEMPPESRWLVMHARLGAAEMGALRLRYAALSNSPALAAQWLASPLGEALAETLPQVASTEPVVLTVSRGRLTLRTAMTLPSADRLTLWNDVFVVALDNVLPLAQAPRDADADADADRL